MAVVARDALPTHLFLQSQVPDFDGDRGVALQAGFTRLDAEVSFGQRERILKQAAFHGLGVRGGFPGFMDTPVAAAAQLSGGWWSHIGSFGGTDGRKQQKRKQHERLL
jgi:hypothetical protein